MGAGDEVSESSGGEGVKVNIRCSNGTKFSVDIDLESSVETFKAALAEKCEVPPQQQRLIYKGRILKDDQTLKSYESYYIPFYGSPLCSMCDIDLYGLEADHTVHLVRGFAPAASTNNAAPTDSGGSTTTPNSTRPVSTNEGDALGGAGLGASLFPGLGINGLGGSGGGLFGAGLPEFEQVQQQLTRNPNIMREIMNMPVVQNLMNNPEIMRNLIMNNPQMREIIDRNPELAHILNDPSTLRQTLEAARNPELMREMMRNTDRAMSNIESSPEGFNMLRRMYETVQEPFLNATSMAGNAGNDNSNPFAALLGTQGGNQAREGSNNPSTTTSESTTGSPAPNTNPLPNPWMAAGTGGSQTNTTRSSSLGDARPQTPAGIAGLSSPGFEDIFGAMQDTNSLNQMLQNPAVTQMMQSLLSNPQYMNQILGLNPQLRSMVDSNSQLREMIQNPEFLRQLTNPETMQQMVTLQQFLLTQLGRAQSTQQPGQTGGGTVIRAKLWYHSGTIPQLDPAYSGHQSWIQWLDPAVVWYHYGTPNMGLEMLMNMFGGLGAGSLAVPNRSDVPPEQLYATQLSQLQEMGFFDTQENIRALIATAGNVHAAVERLLGNSGQ
ncbi:ubiquitin domain-containing protein DSK2b [Citrus sinensis]|uniref:Ubiquitin domain-containing protein DSK2b n=1 Tax=Citrus sinensis TaxID=2711 RepID=A0ACB8IYU8_CITSI|nr:ubiquitin domain-containing protein DSK2b [Citrus sinensis]